MFLSAAQASPLDRRHSTHRVFRHSTDDKLTVPISEFATEYADQNERDY